MIRSCRVNNCNAACYERIHLLHFSFCVQAEDGIRYLVRSRGLGDVYKRQGRADAAGAAGAQQPDRGRRHQPRRALADDQHVAGVDDVGPVSYTHLTLPTSDLV